MKTHIFILIFKLISFSQFNLVSEQIIDLDIVAQPFAAE